MLMKARERWHCTNNECGCQVVVEISGEVEGPVPAARNGHDPADRAHTDLSHLPPPQ